MVHPTGDIFCYRGHSETHHLGVGFLVHKVIAGNRAEFHSINQRVASLVIRLNNKHTLHVVPVYAPTSTYDDEAVDVFYEDIELEIRQVKSPYIVIKGDFNAKIESQQLGEHAVGKMVAIPPCENGCLAKLL